MTGAAVYNQAVLRRVTAATLAVLVQVGAISAPLMHVHAGEEGDHAGEALHAHLQPGHHDGDHASIDHGDEGRPIAAQVFVAVPVVPFDPPALGVSTFALVAPPEMLLGRARHIAHGHDPPLRRLRPSRAPPAFPA